jgi:hypothetical protein
LLAIITIFIADDNSARDSGRTSNPLASNPGIYLERGMRLFVDQVQQRAHCQLQDDGMISNVAWPLLLC